MNLLRRIRRKVSRVGGSAFHAPANWWLAGMSRDEQTRFMNMRQQASGLYAHIRMNDGSSTTRLWTEFNTALERALLPTIPYSFLRNDIISATMVMTRGGALLREQLSYLESQFSPSVLKSVLRESAVGHPHIASWKYMSSHNSIHHLYHLARYIEVTKVSLNSIVRVVEWGGGYGNFARICSRLSPVQRQYVIIDTPVLCILQWLYLSSVMPDVPVRLISSPDEPVLDTGIVILPAQWYAHYNLSPDLFISTWALSESPLETQTDIGQSRNWFGASHLLLGYQESNALLPHAGHVGELASASNASISDLPVLKGQHYAFR